MATRAIALTLAGHRPIALEVPAMPAWGGWVVVTELLSSDRATALVQQDLDAVEHQMAERLNTVRGLLGNLEDMIPDAEIARSLFPAFVVLETEWAPWAERRASLQMLLNAEWPNSLQEQTVAILNTGERIEAVLRQTRDLLEAMALIDQHPRDARKLDVVKQERVSKLAMRRMQATYEPDPIEEALMLHYANATKLILEHPDDVE
jgi:hypothetical protein